MTQLSGAFTIEIDTGRLADAIAEKVLARLDAATGERRGTEDFTAGDMPPRGHVGYGVHERPDQT